MRHTALLFVHVKKAKQRLGFCGLRLQFCWSSAFSWVCSWGANVGWGCSSLLIQKNQIHETLTPWAKLRSGEVGRHKIRSVNDWGLPQQSFDFHGRVCSCALKGRACFTCVSLVVMTSGSHTHWTCGAGKYQSTDLFCRKQRTIGLEEPVHPQTCAWSINYLCWCFVVTVGYNHQKGHVDVSSAKNKAAV